MNIKQCQKQALTLKRVVSCILAIQKLATNNNRAVLAKYFDLLINDLCHRLQSRIKFAIINIFS